MNSYKLNELIDIRNGTTYYHLNNGSIPLYGSGGLMSYVDDFLFDGEAILLPRKGTLNNILYTEGKIWTVDTMYYATTNEIVLPYYLYCYLSLLDLRHLNSGSAVPSMTKSAYYNIEIKLPDIPIQLNVVNFVKSIDKKIELNDKLNTNLEAMAKLIYDYWFVQFDFPDENGKPYKSSGGTMVYNKELKRDIPEGWSAKELGEIEPNIITGKTPSKANPENFGGEVPFICIGDVRGNMHVTETEETLSKLGADSQSKKYVPKGSICVTCIATPGLVGFATEDSQTNQQLNTIICDDLKNRYFLYFYIKDYFRFAKAKSGNTFANMNKDDFSSINIIHPRKDILERFNDTLDSSIEKILLNSKENNKLRNLRDWLLPMLMNGQVKIK